MFSRECEFLPAACRVKQGKAFPHPHALLLQINGVCRGRLYGFDLRIALIGRFLNGLEFLLYLSRGLPAFLKHL